MNDAGGRAATEIVYAHCNDGMGGMPGTRPGTYRWVEIEFKNVLRLRGKAICAVWVSREGCDAMRRIDIYYFAML